MWKKHNYRWKKQTIYGNRRALFNDRIAAKTTIDFLSKYTAPLKIQLIKRRLQIAAAAANTLKRQRQFTLVFARSDEQGDLGFFQFLAKLTLCFFLGLWILNSNNQ